MKHAEQIDGSPGGEAASMTIDEYVKIYQSANKSSSKTEIAAMLGITPAYLCQILAKRRTPSLGLMESIAIRTGGIVSVGSWGRRKKTSR